MRTLPEWFSDDHDAPVPPHVKVRIFDRCAGICEICKRKIRASEEWQLDHHTALVNGGEHREFNLRPLHVECHASKTGDDVAEKSKTYRIRAKHLGIALKRKQQWGWR